MDTLIVKTTELDIIQSKIHEIRGNKVMLDFDLAMLYQVETKNLKRVVKRNLKRFPPDFMFELTKEEYENLRRHFGTSSWGGTRYLPYAFTEQGVAMLSGLLNSEIAIEVNISIMRAFVYVRHIVTTTPTDKVSELRREIVELKAYLKRVFDNYDAFNEDTRKQLETLNEVLGELQMQKNIAEKPRRPIGYLATQERMKQ